MKNEYDQIRGMLKTIRQFENRTTKNLREQVETQTTDNSQPLEKNDGEYGDVDVINNVDVNLHSEDSMDVKLSDEEKGNISQMIDDFRTQVSSTVEFDKIDIYSNGVKMTGKIENYNMTFVFSGGDGEGLYISNPSMLKIDDESLSIINKLKKFQENYISVVNVIIINRKQN
jgi:hypothetical protein